jgi:hypothetical protein
MSDLLDAAGHLPWGLHDGLLTSLRVDYAAATAELHVRFMMNERQTRGRLGCLRISGLLFLSIDPPTWRDEDGTPVDGDNEDGLSIDAGRIGDMKSPPAHVPQVPEGYWINWIYMMEPNSCLYVCARDATFEWIEDAESEVAGGVLFPGDEIPDPST